MADTITLEQVRDEMRAWRSHTGFESLRLLGWADAIDAAIRERDELRETLAFDRDRWNESAHDAAEQRERAERAEAELAEAQNTIAAQQGTMGALKRKLALAEGELAALKARIAGSVELTVGDPAWSDGTLADMDGKRVRLVVED